MMPPTGYLERPKLRAAYDRIVGSCARWPGQDGTRSAEAFLTFLANYADRHDMTFDEACEVWHY